jgi:hypothetical protein
MGNLFAKFFCTIAKVFTLTLFGFDTCMQSFDTDCDAGRRSALLQLGVSGGTSATFSNALLGCIDTRGVDFLTIPPAPVITAPKLLTTATGTCSVTTDGGIVYYECTPVVNAPIAIDVTVCCQPYSSALAISVSGDKTVANAFEPTLDVMLSPVDDVHIGVLGPSIGSCSLEDDTKYSCDFPSGDDESFFHSAIFEF